MSNYFILSLWQKEGKTIPTIDHNFLTPEQGVNMSSNHEDIVWSSGFYSDDYYHQEWWWWDGEILHTGCVIFG